MMGTGFVNHVVHNLIVVIQRFVRNVVGIVNGMMTETTCLTNMSDDLSLIATEKLLEELFNRHEHCLFAGLVTGLGDGSAQQTYRKWKGNYATCAGLAFSVSYAVMQDHYEQSEEGQIG